VWIDYGDNGCHCGLTREGDDGWRSFRTGIDSALDAAVRGIARLYDFSMTEDQVQNLTYPEAVTLRQIMQLQSADKDQEPKRGVYRVTVALQRW
jgi:hypothetical protein